MPLNTMNAPSSDAAYRIAHEAALFPGRRASKSGSAHSGTRASEPPLTGSMTITGLWCRSATS